MAGGAPMVKKGRGPVFWISVGCCGCLLLVLILGGLLGGGAFLMTKGAADAGHAWLTDVREGRTEQALAQLTDDYRSRLTEAELQEIISRIQESTDATFPGRQLHNDRAVLSGVLTGSNGSHPIAIRLVKQDGTWKVDDVTFEEGFGVFSE
jgi:hypothetical protein